MFELKTTAHSRHPSTSENEWLRTFPPHPPWTRLSATSSRCRRAQTKDISLICLMMVIWSLEQVEYADCRWLLFKNQYAQSQIRLSSERGALQKTGCSTRCPFLFTLYIILFRELVLDDNLKRMLLIHFFLLKVFRQLQIFSAKNFFKKWPRTRKTKTKQ